MSSLSPLRAAAAYVFAAVLALSTSSGAQSAAASADGPAVGVQFHATWSSYTDAQRVEVLDKLAAAHIGWVRIDVGWASFQEHGRGTLSNWYVERVDAAVDAARARGLNVLATLWMTPKWANGGAHHSVPPANDADYAQMAEWAAAHFRGRVAAWEVWNEPNHPDFFKAGAARYGALLRTAYPAFKRGDPNALVVLGGPVNNDVAWLEQVYANGGAGSFDVMSTHPYQGVADLPPEAVDNGTKWMLTHVDAVRKLMVAHGDARKPIWFTEFGWSSHQNWNGVENWNRGVSEAEQAAYLVRTLELVKSRFPYVTNVFWYNERNHQTGQPQYDNYGLLRWDLTPKPAYDAVRAYLAQRTLARQSATAPTSDPLVKRVTKRALRWRSKPSARPAWPRPSRPVARLLHDLGSSG